MFCLLSKTFRKMTLGIIINPWNAVLFMANLFVSRHTYDRVRCFITICHEIRDGNQLQGV